MNPARQTVGFVRLSVPRLSIEPPLQFGDWDQTPRPDHDASQSTIADQLADGLGTKSDGLPGLFETQCHARYRRNSQ
jgi:hypothetical protein